MHKEMLNSIRNIAFFLLGLLVILVFYVSYIQVFEADFLASHPLNRRSAELANMVARGQILDKNKQVLAYNVPDGHGNSKRQYPYGAMLAQIVGYSSSTYGKTGIEGTFNGDLSGLRNPARHFGALTHWLEPKAGNNVVLTLDTRLQEVAYRALGNRRGAVVAIAPKTGAILVMASKPSFNPNMIDSDWAAISADTGSPLLNRAVQGLYPPGSIIKVLVAEAALNDKVVDTTTIFHCGSELKIGDYILPEADHEAYGDINLEKALAVSSNVTFGQIALKMGRSRMEKAFERYGFTKPVGDELQEAALRLPDFGRLNDGELAQTGIGQSSLLVTPLRMAMLASSFANKGVIMKPYLVSSVNAPDGGVIKQFSPQQWLAPANAALAEEVGKMMVTVVNEGTGTAARLAGITVAGKTGTAENPHGSPHAWFIGFAPADDPEIAIAVIVENAGAGGGVAAPIARQVLAEALR